MVDTWLGKLRRSRCKHVPKGWPTRTAYFCRASLGLCCAVALAGCTTTTMSEDRAAAAVATLSERVKQLSRGTAWRSVASIPTQFDTHHPQGMVKIGDQFIVSWNSFASSTVQQRLTIGERCAE